jgi:hypothetical protein
MVEEIRDRVVEGKPLEVLKNIPEATFDAIITRLPSPLEFGFGDLGGTKHYIKYLSKIFSGAMRVLKDRGTCWVFVSDSYSDDRLVGLPERFKVMMVDDLDWVHRNTVVCTSLRIDNFYEYLYLFTKDTPMQYYVNDHIKKTQYDHPLGINGIECIDWDWKECKRCRGRGCVFGKECSSCNGRGERKVSHWSGADYYFEQQFEPYKFNRWGGKYKTNEDDVKFTLDSEGQGSLNRMNYDCYPNTMGRNMRCIWESSGGSIEELRIEWLETVFSAGCPEYVCKSCDLPRQKVFDSSERVNTRPSLSFGSGKSGKYGDPNKQLHLSDISRYRQRIVYKDIGYTDCGCGKGFRKGLVLDPFMSASLAYDVAKKIDVDFCGIKPKQLDDEVASVAKKNRGLDRFL